MSKRKTKRKKISISKRKKLTGIQKTIIGVIICAFVVIIVALVSSFVYTPEKIVKSKIENMARNYYENYYYSGLEDAKGNTDEVKTVLKKYKDTGLSVVMLRQLIFHDLGNNLEDSKFITQYCDENKTSVKYFPEEPYEKSSYRIEYIYSCDF